jgi:hypothetical protein
VNREEAERLVTGLTGSERVKFFLPGVDSSGLQVTVGGQELTVPVI